jgi:RNA polymerase sigma-70 factor (ECF subfamily)
MSLEHAPELNDARSGREHCIGLREELGGALQQLTDLQRQVTLLHDVEGWRHREIATSLGISPEASRQHLFVARRRLRKQLRRDLWEEYTE